MMLEEKVKKYYDIHTEGKLRDYIVTNPRIEAAWDTIIDNAPYEVNSILEIGCGIGSVSYKLVNEFENANVVGLDISPKSIEIAEKLFPNPRLSFVEGILHKGKIKDKFDLIVLMDVYEHIAVEDRRELHEAMKELLNERGRIILSFPTPHYNSFLRKTNPDGLQPVDENISAQTIVDLAKDTNTEVIIYKKVNVWREGDYAHAVLERNVDFEKAFTQNLKISLLKRGIRGVKKGFWFLRGLKNKLRVKQIFNR